MNLPKIPICDSMFSHAKSSSGDHGIPKYFEWDRINLNKSYIFLTDNGVFNVKNYNNIKKYAWLVESPVVTQKSYHFVYENWKEFDIIFTHSKKILKKPNSKFLPIGMCHLTDEEVKLDYNKTKLVSMVYSFKNYLPGHMIRHAVASEFNEVVDLMGSGVNGLHVKKIHSCRDYMYSIAIENCREDYYFSEKILDCFLTGTIPIYWGCPSIGNFFDTNGFIIFETIEELYNILKDQEYLYNFCHENSKTKQSIINNYNTALKYKVAEDRLWLDYKEYLE